MSNITNLKNYSSFVKECRFFYCQTVFDGDWDGREKFIVSSDTTENELWMKYPEIMKALSPYMFCNAACGDIYAESLKNINKFRKRSSNTIDFGAIEVLEDQMDIEAPELGIRLILSEGLSVCTPLQRERIQKYYIEGMSLSEIAEGKNISTVQQSIEELDKMQQRLDTLYGYRVKLTPEMRETYKTVGGIPHLDGGYTVFGEIVEGLDVVDKIQQTATDKNDRPLEDQRILKAYVIKPQEIKVQQRPSSSNRQTQRR